jgi:phosphocarrier protein HPr
MGRLSSTLES